MQEPFFFLKKLKILFVPIGKRIKHFIQIWNSLRRYQWILQTIQGFKLEFTQSPHQTQYKHHSIR